MYPIYTYIVGVQIPKKLSRQLMKRELTELFELVYDAKIPDIMCELPYCGDGTPEIHLGVAYGHVDPIHKKIPTPKGNEKQIWEENRNSLADLLCKLYSEFPESTEEDDSLFQQLIDIIRNGETVEYIAYSTS